VVAVVPAVTGFCGYSGMTRLTKRHQIVFAMGATFIEWEDMVNFF
jgi:hypothetical protein